MIWSSVCTQSGQSVVAVMIQKWTYVGCIDADRMLKTEAFVLNDNGDGWGDNMVTTGLDTELRQINWMRAVVAVVI